MVFSSGKIFLDPCYLEAKKNQPKQERGKATMYMVGVGRAGVNPGFANLTREGLGACSLKKHNLKFSALRMQFSRILRGLETLRDFWKSLELLWIHPWCGIPWNSGGFVPLVP